MIPKGCVVEGYRDLFTPAAVRAYRHYGFVLVENFLPLDSLRQLSSLCNDVARRRGEAVFPGIDPEHQRGASFGFRATAQPTPQPGAAETAASQSPSARVTTELGFGSGPIPADLEQKAAKADRQRTFDSRTVKVHVKLKNQRAVDRAFSRLTRMRNLYNTYRDIHQHVGREEELSGELSEERISEVRDKVTYDDLRKSFRTYRDSGKLEAELRRDHHVNEVMRFMQNWPRTWCLLSQSSPELKALALSMEGAVGKRVGEAAGQLSGEVLLRVYIDSAVQDSPLTNAMPLGFAGLGTNFAHPQALSVQLGLAAPASATTTGAATATQAVMPGSHHVIRRIAHDGRELGRFLSGGIFDHGSVVRHLPELAHLPVAEVPPLAPGAALFLNNYVVTGMQPTLEGAAQQAARTVAMTPFAQVTNYTLALMPDRCVFDGQRNSWVSRDTHGPLYTCKAGDLLTDNAKFPVIHRALDIE
ncbi:hypothetical protein ABB37_07847 [Leptomonas pyrrhocoris]|uniref:Uncharacterized protein n=1 Tax=Leptomonas pyrrhocoris TaxID=157538 RepID=A0A0M9FUV6_LEPPY|nr:hypothetical protein ABB37_07847 [Leptomonas pyrrhocoris]XP_015655000.1 hypothetical protein ABB37_07847 [Leptomonas pyrrhocoris]KPA76560.1 hypothetical protein ABB37_07847 [Leptomonas pyrrhocoris]KPA76561.1 hypothetical protein ABB37_07847 [Leptomonas pyrrhocoris]|eukprot:XP_015654999.1 hypothetical protein ABB37_07847 [Leptomonas pyrrhocoris]